MKKYNRPLEILMIDFTRASLEVTNVGNLLQSGSGSEFESDSQSSSSDSNGPNISRSSENYIFGMATPGRRKIPGQIVEFELRSPTAIEIEDTKGGIQESAMIKCVLKFGKDRASTVIPRGQGRHVSSHALLQEVLISRLDGCDVEVAIDILYDTVLQYADGNSKGTEQFVEFVLKVKKIWKSRESLVKVIGKKSMNVNVQHWILK